MLQTSSLTPPRHCIMALHPQTVMLRTSWPTPQGTATSSNSNSGCGLCAHPPTANKTPTSCIKKQFIMLHWSETSNMHEWCFHAPLQICKLHGNMHETSIMHETSNMHQYFHATMRTSCKHLQTWAPWCEHCMPLQSAMRSFSSPTLKTPVQGLHRTPAGSLQCASRLQSPACNVLQNNNMNVLPAAMLHNFITCNTSMHEQSKHFMHEQCYNMLAIKQLQGTTILHSDSFKSPFTEVQLFGCSLGGLQQRLHVFLQIKAAPP